MCRGNSILIISSIGDQYIYQTLWFGFYDKFMNNFLITKKQLQSFEIQLLLRSSTVLISLLFSHKEEFRSTVDWEFTR